MTIIRAHVGFLIFASLGLCPWSSSELGANPAPGGNSELAAAKLIALRVVGSNVRNPQGEYLGRIEEAAINPQTGRIEFAMLQIHYPAVGTRVTPIPWKVLNYAWDQSQAGGVPGAMQTFILNMSRAQLERAPTLDKLSWPSLNEAYWSQRIYAYYGVQAGPGLGSIGVGEQPPAGVEEVPAPDGLWEEDPVDVFPSAAASSLILDTNLPPFVPIPPGATNPIFNTNIFLNTTNFFLNRTNFFLNRTNFFPGTKTPYNPDDPATFPRAGGVTNFNPFVMTNSSPGMMAGSNSSPFTPRFSGATNFPGLPPPVSRNSPWSPQFAGSQNSGSQVPINAQPDPWSPRFISPQGGTPVPVNPQPNPWSPRFLTPDGSAQDLPIQPQPNPWSPRFQNPDFSIPATPTGPQANPWSPAFLPPQSGGATLPSTGAGSGAGGGTGGGAAGNAGAPQISAPPVSAGPPVMIPRPPPVFRSAPARRR